MRLCALNSTQGLGRKRATSNTTDAYLGVKNGNMKIDKTVVDLLVGIITRAVMTWALPALAAPNATPSAPVTKKIESFLKREKLTSIIKLNLPPNTAGWGAA